MPSGDATRTWFPEIVDTLKHEWVSGMSCPDLIVLRDRLDDMLQTIRTDRKILPPIVWCPKCGKKERSASPRISVRALILSLGRFRIAADTEVKELDREWTKYRKKYKLDLNGK